MVYPEVLRGLALCSKHPLMVLRDLVVSGSQLGQQMQDKCPNPEPPYRTLSCLISFPSTDYDISHVSSHWPTNVALPSSIPGDVNCEISSFPIAE